MMNTTPASQNRLRYFHGTWRDVQALLAIVLLLGGAGRAFADDRPKRKIEFNRDVRPILSENCLACHGPDAKHRKAELRLDVRDEAIKKQVVVPGDPQASELIERILTEDATLRMPPASSKKLLSMRQKDILRQWVAEGAEYQKHWAFEPIQKTAPPDIASVSNVIDRFIQGRLAEEGLTPSPLAARETLLRRVSLDLIGLPPTIQEIEEFLKASERDADAAYAELVDRLLSSPHYGERWGRWWLDQARYADSNGYSIDAPRQIWAYRDWVINSFNTDLPFDEFTLHQLAGDLLPNATQSQRVATGFHRNTQINQEGGIDPEQFRIDSVFDRVATTGTVWLGLTIGCCQCHDHKFDPITQKEYYQFFSFLNNQDEPAISVYAPGVDPAALGRRLTAAEQDLTTYFKDHAEAIATWEKSLTDEDKKKLPGPVKAAIDTAADKRNFAQQRTIYAASPHAGEAEFQRLTAAYTDIHLQLYGVPTTLVLQERGQRRKTTIFIKGDFTRPADEVNSGTPALLPALENSTGQANRIDLARWLTNRQNPLTARVIVNRVWQQFFGRGIVETENDFGAQGMPPSHPALLDYLAWEFMERGWRFKELHQLILHSHTYRQSSLEREDVRAKDPRNELLGRQRRLRLEAEIVRDVALTASGLLSHKLGGPPVFPPIPEGVTTQGQGKQAWNVSTGEDRYRRGCYTFLYRATPPPALSVFDGPDGYSTCTRRIRSNTPLQALTLLNDATSFEFARALEKVIQTEGLAACFRRCTSRLPTPEELAVLQPLDPLSVARVLLNLDETISRE